MEAKVKERHQAGVLGVRVEASCGQQLLHRLVNAPQLLPTLDKLIKIRFIKTVDVSPLRGKLC